MTAEDTPTVVFDCNIFVQAFLSETGNAALCLALADQKSVTLLICRDIYAELINVLNRHSLRRKYPNATPERVTHYIRYLRAKTLSLAEVPEIFQHPRDPKDSVYINLAVAGEAKTLVSRDRHLLDLMNDAAFRERFADLRVYTPEEFLQQIASDTQ